MPCVVTSANQDFNPSRLERYLALARGQNVVPIVLITKSDLASDVAEYVAAARALMPGLAVEAIDARRDDIGRVLKLWLGRSNNEQRIDIGGDQLRATAGTGTLAPEDTSPSQQP